jgi:hypothetical protein
VSALAGAIPASGKLMLAGWYACLPVTQCNLECIDSCNSSVLTAEAGGVDGAAGLVCRRHQHQPKVVTVRKSLAIISIAVVSCRRIQTLRV